MQPEDILSTRKRLATDYHRPQYHYLPASNWMNDPNGVIQWNNRYHLFYQYNPMGANHANMHWGHAVSDDMLHWEELPIALAPTAKTVDEGGIFSGCIIDHEGTPKMFYTGVNPDYQIQTQCLAVGNDDLLTWEKHPTNPIIGTVPKEMGQTNDFRDPFVWQGDDAWYMLVGSRMENIGGSVLLYRSDDLINWDYIHPLLVGDISRTGVMWECPNFFPLGDKWVLIISSHIGHSTGTVLYFVGDYHNYRFYPDVEGVMDAGYYYAPLTFLDNQGRRIMYAWLREGRSVEHQVKAEWSGVQAIPRVLSLDAKDRLQTEPIPELATLRGEHHQFTSATIRESDVLPVKGLALEIKAMFNRDAHDEFGIAIATSAAGTEQTRIVYNCNTQTLRIERQYLSDSDGLDVQWQGIPHRLDDGEALDLHLLLDGSVLEIIANQRTSLTSRIYPTHEQHQHIYVINPTALHVLDIWKMTSIW